MNTAQNMTGSPEISEITPAFPRKWAEILPKEAVETASEIVESIYTVHTSPRTDSQSNAHSAAAHRVFPPAEQVFRALDLTPPERVRAVILGQDPYPTAGHAHGLAFSVAPDVRPLPPSLRNIFKEYAACYESVPACGDLTPWAERGVLLLNAVLTVEEGRSGSHRRRGWQSVTDAVLRACLRLPGPCAFLLWGRDAQSALGRAADSLQISVKCKTFTISMLQEFYSGIAPDDLSSETTLQTDSFSDRHSPDGISPRQCCPDRSSPDHFSLDSFSGFPCFPYDTAGEGKFLLRSSHPSPLGASKPCGDSPPFLGSRPFARANALLNHHAIDWRLP